MTRPLMTKEARLRCPHESYALSTYLPGVPYCGDCGVLFETDDGDDASAPPPDVDGVDWAETEKADRKDIEAMGQGRLDLD